MAEQTIIDIFYRRVEQDAYKTAILFKKDGSYKPMTWAEHGAIVERAAAALIIKGLGENDQVAILASTRPEWTWADIAILSTRARTVPIYSTLSESEVRFLVDHSQSKAIFAENERQLAKIIEASEGPPEELEFAVVFDDDGFERDNFPFDVMNFQEFLQTGDAALAQNKDIVKKRRRQVLPEDLATIVYTSGTTGVPKGAMLLHGNIYKVLESMGQLIEFTQDDLALAFLPLSHVFERVNGQFLSIFFGLSYAYAESMEKVAENMIEVKPTLINAVPRFYEKAYQRVQT
ncbi:MAG: AMP-binding protein, partial [Candidatus Obscuribacterales bacterium]|nr:AMP-binding protein [Candidatus Obscuribacterales bacterium]